ncbi:ribokinase [Poseidonocella pacifica]|uniref:Ribokinase n=1 Tax=Poseidonocella pacifica TaxID=871651 RepID=A0A1I0XXD5_9RHOB|nr:ribokinase [Poseidonocella pacifica]SFB04960.1 ribokinase [Poseidonocella pacifica]
MTIWNLGSINVDNFYSVPRIPGPGETIASTELSMGLGGKGANMSVAAARAGAHVAHIGAVGSDGVWARDRLTEFGVDTRHIGVLTGATGHANIMRDTEGENTIVLYPGANAKISTDMIGAAISGAETGDFLLFQNETGEQGFAAETGRKLGMRVAYAVAPYVPGRLRALVPFLDLLILNAVEARQLQDELGVLAGELGIENVFVTHGADGCDWITQGETRRFPAHPAIPVDTTGAGDTFTGYLLAGLDRGHPVEEAIDLASRAAALMVARHGTADVIPDLREVLAL